VAINHPSFVYFDSKQQAKSAIIPATIWI